jgi:hypothetical protein
MANEEPQAIPNSVPDPRWAFLRDVAVFQFKLFLNNLHNFFQIPLTLVIAVVDLVFKTEPEGGRFYKALEYGRMIDDSIDIYSVIAHREKSLNTEFTVDAIVGQLEGVIAKEVEKGGTAASVKSALDKAIDQMQAKADLGKEQAKSAIQKAAEKVLRPKTDGDQA